jgi:hypothetical protein
MFLFSSSSLLTPVPVGLLGGWVEGGLCTDFEFHFSPVLCLTEWSETAILSVCVVEMKSRMSNQTQTLTLGSKRPCVNHIRGTSTRQPGRPCWLRQTHTLGFLPHTQPKAPPTPSYSSSSSPPSLSPSKTKPKGGDLEFTADRVRGRKSQNPAFSIPSTPTS